MWGNLRATPGRGLEARSNPDADTDERRPALPAVGTGPLLGWLMEDS